MHGCVRVRECVRARTSEHACARDVFAIYDDNMLPRLIGRFSHIVVLLLQNDIGHSMKNFITQISNPPTKVMIIGPMFTPEAKVIAETSALYNLVEVSTHFVTIG